MQLLKELYWRFRNYLQLRNYRKMHNRAKMIALAKYIASKNIQPKMEYSTGVEKDFGKIRNRANLAKSKGIKNFYFGDSIGDFLRDKLESIDETGNFCHAGDTGRGFQDVINEVFKIVDGENVENVVIGTFGNNALGYQAVGFLIKELQETYAMLRIYCPNAKIIFLGFPPVYDIYANMIAPIVENRMKELDEHACLIDMADFGKGIWPKLKYSSDGVHMSEYGGYMLDQKIMACME